MHTCTTESVRPHANNDHYVKFPGTQDKYHMLQCLQTRAWSGKAKQYRDQLKLNRKFICINK